MGWFIPSFISQFIVLFGFGYKPIFFLCGFKKRPSWAWCGLQVCSEKWRWEAERIDWLELGKTLYSVFILHSGVFQSVIGSWFFISSEVFHVKNLIFIVSFSHSTLWIIFYFWYHWLLGYTCWMEEIWGDISVMVHGISLIIFLFILFNDIMESIDMSWGDDCSFDLFFRSVEAFAYVLHL